MSDSKKNISYTEYASLNDGKVSRFKYLYMVLDSENIHDDFKCILFGLFNPTIFFLNEGYFIEENFTQDRYDQTVAQGIAPLEIPGWLNMIEITSLLGDVGYDEAAELGALIRDCWNTKLNRQFPDSGFEARLVLEDDLDEVWVTLCKQ